ncbi:MAG TPA: zinc ribbon domain-containing protein [Ktedonobacterales bacterium]|jgi:zinc ribbon protein|nr:zinc ribbon domain-containing protein [Ktedonobacterales bacterium]
MQDMFENAKRVASTAVERAAWEADKVRRASARQREIDLLKRERSAVIEQLAGVLLDLNRRGELTQAPLQAIASRLQALDGDISHGDSEITAIRNETFVPGTISINVQRKDDPNALTSTSSHSSGHLACPSCGRSVRRSAAFCSACGAKLK